MGREGADFLDASLATKERQINVTVTADAHTLAPAGDDPLRVDGDGHIDDLAAAAYSVGIDLLRPRDDANVLCVPDAVQVRTRSVPLDEQPPSAHRAPPEETRLSFDLEMCGALV